MAYDFQNYNLIFRNFDKTRWFPNSLSAVKPPLYKVLCMSKGIWAYFDCLHFLKEKRYKTVLEVKQSFYNNYCSWWYYNLATESAVSSIIYTNSDYIFSIWKINNGKFHPVQRKEDDTLLCRKCKQNGMLSFEVYTK